MSFTQSYFYPTIITNITQLNGGLYGTVKPTDVYPAVDTTDVTQSPYGTTKPYQIIALFNYIITNLGYIVYSPVLAATTANLMSTYNNGISGVGATLTNSGTLAAFTLDGIPGVLNGTYLVKNQTSPAQNGLYTLTTVGDSISVNWVLTRSINFNQTANIFEDGIVFVQYGFTNGGTFWQDIFISPITVGTTAINWAEWEFIVGSGTVNAGLQNELAYYATNGDAVSGLATANSATLATNNAGAPELLGPMTNGELLIGNTGLTPTLATITAGTGVTIANGPGTITVNASGGGVSWTTVTGTTQAAAINNGYVANSNSVGVCVITLPATAPVGSTVEILGLGSEGWTLAANTGQTIQYGNVATSSGGSFSSANQYDTIFVKCMVANTTWSVFASVSAGLIKA